MKLGTQTGSLVNHVMTHGATHAHDIEVNTGATICLYTDRHAGTIIKTFNHGKSSFIVWQRDTAVRVDNNGLSDAQKFEYKSDPNGSTRTFRYDEKKEMWREVIRDEHSGRWRLTGSSTGIILNSRDEYFDFSF